MDQRRSRVLIVDDNVEMARSVADGLADRGLDAVVCSSGSKAARLLEEESFDALVTDLRMPETDGLQLLAIARKLDPDRPVIVMTAYSAVDSAIESIRRGAYHYLTKPFKQDELSIYLSRAMEEARVRREASALKDVLREKFSATGIIGHSPAIEALRERIARIAAVSAPVLLMGEAGVGKGLVARALHADSRRADHPFLAVNCAALPEEILEHELFGSTKRAGAAGAGARVERRGLFDEAHGGTLFLDEVGAASAAVQSQLLRVVETGAIRPVGGFKDSLVDVRLIASSHHNLAQLVREGRFRQDLLSRLDVISVVVPTLRDRPEDIPELLEHFLLEARGRHPQSPVRAFSPEALDALTQYGWPGNVRELAHAVERAVVLGRTEEVGLAELSESIRGARSAAPLRFQGAIIPMRELERRYAAWVVAQTGGHRRRASEQLGVDPKTLRKWLGETDASDVDLGS